MAIYENVNGTLQDPYGNDSFDWVTNSYDVALLDLNNDGLVDIFSGKCQGYEVIMSNNCALAASSADYDLDGIPTRATRAPPTQVRIVKLTTNFQMPTPGTAWRGNGTSSCCPASEATSRDPPCTPGICGTVPC